MVCWSQSCSETYFESFFKVKLVHVKNSSEKDLEISKLLVKVPGWGFTWFSPGCFVHAQCRKMVGVEGMGCSFEGLFPCLLPSEGAQRIFPSCPLAGLACAFAALLGRR